MSGDTCKYWYQCNVSLCQWIFHLQVRGWHGGLPLVLPPNCTVQPGTEVSTQSFDFNQSFRKKQRLVFQDDLLAPPVYTRPANFEGHSVPDILRSGHEGKINDWRHEQSLQRTKSRRPDLL